MVCEGLRCFFRRHSRCTLALLYGGYEGLGAMLVIEYVDDAGEQHNGGRGFGASLLGGQSGAQSSATVHSIKHVNIHGDQYNISMPTTAAIATIRFT